MALLGVDLENWESRSLVLCGSKDGDAEGACIWAVCCGGCGFTGRRTIFPILIGDSEGKGDGRCCVLLLCVFLPL